MDSGEGGFEDRDALSRRSLRSYTGGGGPPRPLDPTYGYPPPHPMHQTYGYLAGGAHNLHGGAHPLHGGAHNLHGGAHNLHGGAHTLHGGAHILLGGAHTLHGGAHTLHGGGGLMHPVYNPQHIYHQGANPRHQYYPGHQTPPPAGMYPHGHTLPRSLGHAQAVIHQEDLADAQPGPLGVDRRRGSQVEPLMDIRQGDPLDSLDIDGQSQQMDKRWSHLKRVQEATKLQRENVEGSSPSLSGRSSPPPLSSRQLEQFAATYSRATARQLYIQRKDGGFGFTLRHFIVYPPEEGETGGPPISDPLDTIFVKFIKDGGPAVIAGLNIGDRIVSVNGESVAGRSYAQVVQMIQKSRNMLRLVVVPKQDDILQVYFSEIAENPETNKRQETGAKPPWPASVCSSSSRESSPFSSKTSDSARDSVNGPGVRGQPDIRSLYPRSQSRPQGQHQNSEWENLYETIDSDRLKVPPVSHSMSSGSTEHVYAVPAMAGSSSSTLESAPNNSRDSLDSDSSLMAGFHSQQDEPLLNKIKKDSERKVAFLNNQTYPAYLSSPPKDIDSSPYGIASLANTMPPPKEEKKEDVGEGGPATKNFFMDIYAKEVSKMQSVSKSSSTAKKRNFDSTQFNTYGLPLGYRRGGNYYDIDNFSRNNFVIIGSRSLHCEPPQVYQPTPEPPPPVCGICYEYPAYLPGYCPACPPPPPCPECSIMTMTTPYHPRPPRPSTLPGLQSFDERRGRHDSPGYAPLPPTLTTPVHMHPDPQNITNNTVYAHDTAVKRHTTTPDNDGRQVVHRQHKYTPEEDEERNLRRVSYLQATKEERMDTQLSLANETGIAPTHSIKKLKSIFSDKAVEAPLTAPSPTEQSSAPDPPSPKDRDTPKIIGLDKSGSLSTLAEGIKEGYLTCKVAILDGRKATDRSWKTVYAVLKAKALYMYKDKKMAQDNLEYEEKPVKLAESEVEVANDYTKRKNVFRVKTEQGSEYLFQAENEILMKDWVKIIDETAMAIIVDERKDLNKLKKLTSFRNRSPTGQSPSSKTRKPSADPVPNYKDKKNWKGKVVQQLKRMGGGGHGPLYPEGGSICVPLDECPLCPEFNDNELVPYLVKVCCDIVNEKGLEIVGIYRVPGNNAAVTYLTEQINKGVHAFALEDYRWQDVNVVSSLLKSFFRKLPDPLFTVEMYGSFIEASKIEQPAKRLEALRRLVRDMPDAHHETLRYLIQHLCNVADHSNINKMEVRNLAIVFGPTLVRTTDDNMVSMVTDMSQQCRIIESLLSNWDYFFTDSEEVEVREEFADDNMLTGSGNQSIMLANLHKLEDAGKLTSPKGDVSAKDIVTSIISAANRKMLRTGVKPKKESLSDQEERSSSRMEESNSDSRRESESVIHGALQIASALPGLVGSISSSSVPGSRAGSGTDTPSDEIARQHSYSRQGSRGSLSGDIFKRRGSLPICQSKRGSICAYSGGAMCESTPMGEFCEARIALMKSDTETVINGSGENQEIIRGQLSLVNVDSTSPEPAELQSQYKFPIETYTGLDAATAERIKKFEAETKAMLARAPPEHPAKIIMDGQTNRVCDNPLRSSSESSLNSGSAALVSVTTPVPDTNPLHGGILVQEPYHTDAYDHSLADGSYLASYRGSSIPSLLDVSRDDIPREILAAFDTNKVAARGTLQRRKVVRTRPEHSNNLEAPIEEVSDVEMEDQAQDAESLLGKLSASFDQKMRFLLDPDYHGGDQDDQPGPWTQQVAILDNTTKKKLDDVKNSLLRDKANKKVELKRVNRVDRNSEPDFRKGARQDTSGARLDPNGARQEPKNARQDPVLRQVNHRKPLKRSDSLTKKEKTELNLKTKEVEKENKVMKLKEHFEQGVIPNRPTPLAGRSSTKFDVNKVRKKLSDSRNRRIKRRHTVGGTKDFTESILSTINTEKVKSSWDRLAPIISHQELTAAERWSLEKEERRLSLPDCGVDRLVESHV